jgi:hypothetical protein
VRVTNRIAAALLAAAIAAAGVITIVEMVDVAFNNGYAIVDWQPVVSAMARNTWSDTGPALLGAILGLAGLLLLVLGLRRGRPEWFAVQPTSTRTSTFASTRGISRALAGAAHDVDGVTRTTVRIRRRRARVKIETHPRVNPAAPDQVYDEIRARLASFELVSPPRVKLRVKALRPAYPGSGVVPEPSPAPAPVVDAQPAPTRPSPVPAGPASAPSVPETLFEDSTVGTPIRPYPAGPDLTKHNPTKHNPTKPDPEHTRVDDQADRRTGEHD